MINATAATARQFETGDVVYGRAILEGKIQPRRKGVVLGAFEKGDSKRVVVWWYGQGACSVSTSTLMWNDELAPAGDIFDMSHAVAYRLMNQSGGYFRAEWVQRLLINHVRRMAELATK